MKNKFLNLSVERYVFPFTLAFCFSPYLGILIYLRVGMHATTELAAAPSGWFLGILALLGIFVPSFGLIAIIKRLIQERKNFRLNLLTPRRPQNAPYSPVDATLGNVPDRIFLFWAYFP